MNSATFRIAAAQVPSVRGDIAANIATYAATMAAAARHGVTVLVFPELSLTGYEPDLAAALALTAADPRLAPLVALARKHRIAATLGAPLQNSGAKPALGAILITADGETKTYRKMHLGGSERVWFSPGDAPLAFAAGGQTVGLAICADSSEPAHPQAHADLGATIYAAGVFLNAEWYATDVPRLAAYAARHQMLTLMANHGSSLGTLTSVGKSAAWAPDGSLLAQADGDETALVIATRDASAWRGEVVRI
jgi:predicted amidohydrolase